MEGYAIEVADGLVDMGRRSTVVALAVILECDYGYRKPRESLGKYRLN